MLDGPHPSVRLDLADLFENHLAILEENHVEPQTRVCGEILGTVPGHRDAARAMPGARDVAVREVHVDTIAEMTTSLCSSRRIVPAERYEHSARVDTPFRAADRQRERPRAGASQPRHEPAAFLVPPPSFPAGRSPNAGHGAAIFVQCQHRGVEDVFESRQVRDGLQPRSVHDFMRLPLRHDSSRVQHNDLVAKGKHFLAIVRDEKNRDAVMQIPLAQIADERRLRRTIERSQRLIEQQGARFGYQRPRQGDALASPPEICAGRRPHK